MPRRIDADRNPSLRITFAPHATVGRPLRANCCKVGENAGICMGTTPPSAPEAAAEAIKVDPAMCGAGRLPLDTACRRGHLGQSRDGARHRPDDNRTILQGDRVEPSSQMRDKFPLRPASSCRSAIPKKIAADFIHPPNGRLAGRIYQPHERSSGRPFPCDPRIAKIFSSLRRENGAGERFRAGTAGRRGNRGGRRRATAPGLFPGASCR